VLLVICEGGNEMKVVAKSNVMQKLNGMIEALTAVVDQEPAHILLTRDEFDQLAKEADLGSAENPQVLRLGDPPAQWSALQRGTYQGIPIFVVPDHLAT
jgi:hypothetical protein